MRASETREEHVTRYIHTDMGDCLAWMCEQCEVAWSFDWGSPEGEGFCYCPRCGRLIVEHVPYQDPLDFVDTRRKQLEKEK